MVPIDADFEVTAEMLIHEDVDDESTLEEEEAFQTQEENEEELTDLQDVRELGLVKYTAVHVYYIPRKFGDLAIMK